MQYRPTPHTHETLQISEHHAETHTKYPSTTPRLTPNIRAPHRDPHHRSVPRLHCGCHSPTKRRREGGEGPQSASHCGLGALLFVPAPSDPTEKECRRNTMDSLLQPPCSRVPRHSHLRSEPTPLSLAWVASPQTSGRSPPLGPTPTHRLKVKAPSMER